MDFKHLLQLAGENSAFAKKKAERLSTNGNNDINVSTSAVAKYLAKQKQIKERQIAEEQAAKQRRVKARLEASLGKKKVDPKKQTQPKKDDLKKDHIKTKEDIKFKVDPSFKKKEKRDDRGHKKHDEKIKLVSKDEKHAKKNIVTKDIPKLKNEHRKEDNRIPNDKKKKPKSSKNKTNGGSGMSFTDLMKLAKMNSENPGMKKKELPNNTLKRPQKTEKEPFDPDRLVKPKVKRKDGNKDVYQESRKKEKEKQKYNDISKKQRHLSDHSKRPSEKCSQQTSSKNSKKPPEPVKRGMIMETISSSKTEMPMKKLTSSYKQVKHNGRHSSGGGGGGIAAQNLNSNNRNGQKNGKLKKAARDIEDEFEKEERALARKRKLFEMRRITGNMSMQEEDLFGEDEYDLDDEEDEEEDDDFIDDSEQAGDVSKHIRSIFGYDRRRYDDSDEDDDLRNMESNYSQIAKEEARSARIAKIEDDYEKMKETEEEERLKRKKMKRKL